MEATKTVVEKSFAQGSDNYEIPGSLKERFEEDNLILEYGRMHKAAAGHKGRLSLADKTQAATARLLVLMGSIAYNLSNTNGLREQEFKQTCRDLTVFYIELETPMLEKVYTAEAKVIVGRVQRVWVESGSPDQILVRAQYIKDVKQLKAYDKKMSPF